MSSALHHGKTLVLGLGNDVLTDDAVGLRTVRELQRVLAADPRFDFSISTEMGLTLLDLIGGYDALVLIDSVQTGQAEPGCLHCIPPDAGPSEASRTPHFLGVPETITLGRALGYEMPGKVRVYGIEVTDPFTLGTTMTAELEVALPAVVRAMMPELEYIAHSATTLSFDRVEAA